jgi:hypothetical protein
MPRTYEPIASTTLGSNTATVTFDNIPGTYTDLILVGRFGIQSGNQTELYVRFNSDSGSNYSHTALFGGGSSAASNRASSASLGILVSTSDSSAVSTFSAQVMSYPNTNVNKTVLSAYAAPGRDVGRTVGLWRSTSAITRIDISRNASSNDVVSGSTFALYGIKAA